MAELDGLGERKITFNVDRSYRQREENTRVTIQFDAAFNKRNSKSASSLVVRGPMGEILGSKTVLHNNVSSPFAAKAYAGLHAITLGISMGILSVAIMGDSRTFIHRSENVYAHKLAQEALEKGEDSHLMRVVSDHNRSALEGRWLRNSD
ncbi:hypothetical protein Golax_005713 [Gossypium laxum]|uniref:RNase H type-1 domain-containing protein n=1 Tax=Gossypium laxum TaxID=34288 RepID=A0A7J9A276_9ROSI|nr:hypothetical protein [Gossypium laxum]